MCTPYRSLDRQYTPPHQTAIQLCGECHLASREACTSPGAKLSKMRCKCRYVSKGRSLDMKKNGEICIQRLLNVHYERTIELWGDRWMIKHKNFQWDAQYTSLVGISPFSPSPAPTCKSRRHCRGSWCGTSTHRPLRKWILAALHAGEWMHT